MLLSIDTCEETCSVALLDSVGSVMARTSDTIGRGHAERLLPLINELLSSVNTEYSCLTRIAVTTGPGSFTGVRVGLCVARGLALGLNVPCVGFSSLHVLAAKAFEALQGKEKIVHALVKGRGGQAFHQAFQLDENVDNCFSLSPVSPGTCQFEEGILALFAQYGGVFIGSGVDVLTSQVARQLVKNIVMTDLGIIDPAVLGRLSMLVKAKEYPPQPYYLRGPDATVKRSHLPIVP